MTKIIEVFDCDSCPYRDGDFELCTKGDLEVPLLPEDDGIPSWCPLPNKQEKGENDNGK